MGGIMPIISPETATSGSTSDDEDFDDFNDDVDIYEEADVEDLEPYIDEGNEAEKKRHALINILIQGDEEALNRWLSDSNRAWQDENIISDVLFHALQLSSFEFISLLFAKAFRELGMAQMDDSPLFIKELDLLMFHYNARNFKTTFNEFIQKALLPLPNIGQLVIQQKEENAIDLSSEQSIASVFDTLFSWVETVSLQGKRFSMLKDSALDEDASRRPYWSSYFFGATSRKEEIDGYFRNHDVVAALALTFCKGGLTSTASEHLFLKIIHEIKEDIKNDLTLAKEQGYALIALFNEEEHKKLYCRHFHDAAIVSRTKVEQELELLPQSSPY